MVLEFWGALLPNHIVVFSLFTNVDDPRDTLRSMYSRDHMQL